MEYTLHDVLFVVDVIIVCGILGMAVAQVMCVVTRWLWNREE